MEVAVSALRAELKTWIARARAGEEVVVTERGVPVARLTGVATADLLAELAQQGLLRQPTGPRAEPAAADLNADPDPTSATEPDPARATGAAPDAASAPDTPQPSPPTAAPRPRPAPQRHPAPEQPGPAAEPAPARTPGRGPGRREGRRVATFVRRLTR